MDRFSLPGAADGTMVGCLLADVVMSRTLFIFFMNVTDVSVCNSVARSSNGARACQDHIRHSSGSMHVLRLLLKPIKSPWQFKACNPGDVIQQPKSVRAAVISTM